MSKTKENNATAWIAEKFGSSMLMELLLNQTHTYKFNGQRYLFSQFSPFRYVRRCVRDSLKINCMARNSRSVNFTFTFIDITSWRKNNDNNTTTITAVHMHACMHAPTTSTIYTKLFSNAINDIWQKPYKYEHTRAPYISLAVKLLFLGLGVNSGDQMSDGCVSKVNPLKSPLFSCKKSQKNPLKFSIYEKNTFSIFEMV